MREKKLRKRKINSVMIRNIIKRSSKNRWERKIMEYKKIKERHWMDEENDTDEQEWEE